MPSGRAGSQLLLVTLCKVDTSYFLIFLVKLRVNLHQPCLGFCKFGFYEIFKDLYSNMAGEQAAKEYRGLIYLAGSASAEFFADIALCPMEMVKVKVQTSPAGTFPLELGPAVAAMQARKAETRFPFGSVCLPIYYYYSLLCCAVT